MYSKGKERDIAINLAESDAKEAAPYEFLKLPTIVFESAESDFRRFWNFGWTIFKFEYSYGFRKLGRKSLT